MGDDETGAIEAPALLAASEESESLASESIGSPRLSQGFHQSGHPSRRSSMFMSISTARAT
jgi:hypothetical protein